MGITLLFAGQRFGRLVVKEKATSQNGHARWVCTCDCGNTVTVKGIHLRNGHTQSCGCAKIEEHTKRLTKHGGCGTSLYDVWCSAKERCNNPNAKRYEDYGGRGITFHAEWSCDFGVFREWAYSNGYHEGMTLDRIDNNKGYSPENCRWVSDIVQANNKRNNRLLTCDGKTMTAAQWARETGISYDKLRNRLHKGWDVEKALKTP